MPARFDQGVLNPDLKEGINGVARVTDRPAHGRCRAFLVEPGLEQDGHAALDALVADYLRQAARLQAIPMAPAVG